MLTYDLVEEQIRIRRQVKATALPSKHPRLSDYKNTTKVLVFGTFDQLNAGQIAFLEQAQRFGNELIVLVVGDDFVAKYKGKPAIESLTVRMAAVRRLPFKPKVYQEDIRKNWESLKTIKPDVIVLSAEQQRWQHRLDVLLTEYNLPTGVEVLPELTAGTVKAAEGSGF